MRVKDTETNEREIKRQDKKTDKQTGGSEPHLGQHQPKLRLTTQLLRVPQALIHPELSHPPDPTAAACTRPRPPDLRRHLGGGGSFGSRQVSLVHTVDLGGQPRLSPAERHLQSTERGGGELGQANGV